METKTIVIWCLTALFAFIHVAIATEEDKSAIDDISSSERLLQKRSDPGDDITDSYMFTDADLDELVKRGSLLRFGKRGSLLRFGKRGSLLRFGKRGSLFRFGKRYDEHVEKSYPYADDNSDWIDNAGSKRGRSLFRFGKKRSSLFRFGRSADKAPHTPFRFGREEVY